MFVQESATERADESLGVQFEWLDVTGMYPNQSTIVVFKYHLIIQKNNVFVFAFYWAANCSEFFVRGWSAPNTLNGQGSESDFRIRTLPKSA